MNPSLARDTALLIEDIEAAAWRDLHASATDDDRAALGLRPRDLAGGWLMAADRMESLLHNRALGLGLHEPLAPAALDELLGHYRDRVPGFALNLCPLAASEALEHELVRRGFATWFHHLKWVRAAERAPRVTSALRVESVPPERAHEWGELAARIMDSPPGYAAWSARAVGRPGWSHYFAYANGTPVAVAAMFVRGEAAWLGSGGTLESHRRQGAHNALFAVRIADALAQGVRWLTTETAPDWPDLPRESLRNAQRAGFHPAYERPSWIWPSS